MAVSRNCHHCGKRFTTSADRRLFCADICETRYKREHALKCFYCGDLADTIDHVFPQVHGGANGETVQACRDCNCRMGASGAFSVEERVCNLIESLERKYQLNRAIPEWDDDELEELGRSLRDRIQATIRQRQNALERVIHIRARLREIRRLSHARRPR